MPRHIITAKQFDRDMLAVLFTKTAALSERFRNKAERRGLRRLLEDKKLFSIFYEPSTRTRLSFEAAAHHLGMRVMGTENAGEFSSAIKGETIEDTIRVLCAYLPDAIILRHTEAGAAARAADIADTHGVPIINAGDGTGQHPTQALLDLYTIHEHRGGQIDGVTVVLGGDLAYGRTARSLVYLLAKYDDVQLIFVAPTQLAMRDDILAHLDEHGVSYRAESSLPDALAGADVVYWTRIQKERLPDPSIYVAVQDKYSIGRAELEYMKQDAIIMHPLPRVHEIKPEVDDDPRAVYFTRQVQNGMLIRMALLLDVCGESA